MAKIKKARIDKRQTSRDTGIATVDAPMSTGKTVSFKMQEAVRDALNNKYKYGYQPQKRFDPNKATTAELEAIRFSGFRVNNLAQRVELWIIGRLGGHKPLDAVSKDPSVLATLHEEVCATIGTIVSLPAKTKQDVDSANAIQDFTKKLAREKHGK